MKFTKGADVNMTGLRGYVRTTFRELTEVFGLNAELVAQTIKWNWIS